MIKTYSKTSIYHEATSFWDVSFGMIFIFLYFVIFNTYLFKYRKKNDIDAFSVLWLHFRGKLLLQGHSHMTTTVNKSWPKTKNTGQCGRYTARYWKWQMVFHVPLTFSAVASHLLPGLQAASPFPLRGPRSPLTDGGGAPLDHQLTVRECLAAALCPEDTLQRTSAGASAHERFTRRLCLSRKSSQDVLFWNANTTGCSVRACRRVRLS